MYVISYDIDKDKVRSKVAKLLENYGTRVQYSVFECSISEVQFEELYSQLATLMSGEIEGSIRFYQLCKNCMSKIAILGCKSDTTTNDMDDLFII
ncbi:MAG: CRISPR-associated endonuclease Cas2 [Butyrivibrio sp.]|nr:CRISPR-associated endonuclease Cas2 [Butyrivibrio sp.]